MVDAGANRAEILSKTGSVLGAADANLTVNEGEISVLMGLSGSGKSTVLRAVNGLNKVARGQVLVKDGDRMVDVASCDRQHAAPHPPEAGGHGVPAVRASALADCARECRLRARACRRSGARAASSASTSN